MGFASALLAVPGLCALSPRVQTGAGFLVGAQSHLKVHNAALIEVVSQAAQPIMLFFPRDL